MVRSRLDGLAGARARMLPIKVIAAGIYKYRPIQAELCNQRLVLEHLLNGLLEPADLHNSFPSSQNRADARNDAGASQVASQQIGWAKKNVRAHSENAEIIATPRSRFPAVPVPCGAV